MVRDDGDFNSGSYRRGHWVGCSCSDCEITYAGHNSWGNSCNCRSCKYKRALTLEREVSVSTINICDRDGCGAMVKSDAAGIISWQLNPNVGAESKQLCPACVADLVTWLDAKVGDRERAYSKPYEAPKSDAEDPMATLARELLETLREAQKGNQKELTDGDDKPAERAERPGRPRNRIQDDSDW